jgi:hypothetical protein
MPPLHHASMLLVIKLSEEIIPLEKLKNGNIMKQRSYLCRGYENQSTEKRNTTIMLFAVWHIKKIKHKNLKNKL